MKKIFIITAFLTTTLSAKYVGNGRWGSVPVEYDGIIR